MMFCSRNGPLDGATSSEHRQAQSEGVWPTEGCQITKLYSLKSIKESLISSSVLQPISDQPVSLSGF